MRIRALPRATAILVAVVISGLAAAALPASSHASATGKGWWGWHEFPQGVWVPSGQLTGSIQSAGWPWSSGRYVQSVKGSFIAAGRLCNWNMSFDFYDSSGRLYQQYRQPVDRDCDTFDWQTVNFTGFYGWKAKEGRGCIRMYRDFGRERLASVCHAIVD